MLAFGGRQVEDLAIGYTVEVDASSGIASLRVPVLPPPGRGNLAPPLVLSYSSGGGNSAFGAGWNLSGLPAVGLDTSRNVARWDGTDSFQIGGDELVPWLERQNGQWVPRGFERGDWSVAYFRSRRGSVRLRVEKWLHRPTGRVHFRSRDVDNLLTIYGARSNAAARISDPADDSRTLLWLPELMLDPHGNAMWIDYLAETADGIDRSAPNERRQIPLAQRYLKRIRYGNETPLALDDEVLGGAAPTGLRWCFQLVLDYGDHDPTGFPAAAPDRTWPARVDPFSSNRNGFELRTWRLCRRFLSFHDFPELGDGPTLTAALTLRHAPDPAGTTVTEIGRVGYRRTSSGIISQAIPPIRLTYAPAATAAAFSELPAAALENVPAGLAQSRVAFVDLLGDGLSGILSETDRAWFYKPNLGDGKFDAQGVVLERPAVRPGTFGLGDMDANGDTDLSLVTGRLAGLYERDREHDVWENFRPFADFPHVEALGDRVRWVDLNGDGRSDLVISREDRLVWFASEGETFAPPVEVPRPDGPDAAPTLTSDPALNCFFADMDGDGLADFVRIRNGCVEYWPGLGNGKFGERVVMADAPVFDDDVLFDAQRLRFVDLDGSGTTDLVYLGHGEVRCWINARGNRLLPGPRLAGLPYLDSLANVRIFDFLGDGRACLVWSSPLPGRDSPIQYLPLTPAVQPRLLIAVRDELGREIQLTYSSSARHYLRDLADGRGWTARLPVHRMVVDRQEDIDLIAGTSSVKRYAYHDGYYDGGERVFRGFGQVEITDTDLFTGPDPPPEAFAAPALTRLWFHFGTPMWDRHRPADTYAGDPNLPRLDTHLIDGSEELTPEEIEDGLRALAGRMIRREIYALDARGLAGAHPIAVSQLGHRLRRLQPAQHIAPAAFFVTGLEQATWTYEQAAGDPRVTHQIVLAFDEYEQPLREAVIAYRRRAGRPRDVAAQDLQRIQVHDSRHSNIDEPDRYELGVEVEDRRLEMVGVRPNGDGLFTSVQLNAAAVSAAIAAPGSHEVELADDPALGPRTRLLDWQRKLYWNAARDAVLPLGQVGPLTLVHHDEEACFSPAFIAATIGQRIDDATIATLGYSEHDGLWWRFNEVHTFAPTAQFSQRVAMRRSDGAETRFTYDAHSLLLTEVVDSVGNVLTAVNDYHRLMPSRLTDANGNFQEVRYDSLGVIVAETRHGHIDQDWGFDPLDMVVARTPASLTAALADPKSLIQGAAAYTWYDLDAFARDGAPSLLLTLRREDLLRDGSGGGTDGRIATRITYLDGLGRKLQQKMLVESGPAIQRDSAGKVVLDAAGHPMLAPATARWLTSGHTVYDAKQRPIQNYEPFFSPNPTFEDDEVLRQFGVTTLISYDAVGREITQHLPNGTLTRVRIGAWRIEDADPNDTVMESAWRAIREALSPDAAQRQALEQARPHANTTRLTFLDAFGRAVATVAQGGTTAPDRRIEVQTDIDGQTLAIVDPRGLTAFRYRRDMQGRLVKQDTVDAGVSFALPDAYDRDAIGWDARGFVVRRGYDLVDRPTFVQVSGGDGPAPLDHRVEEYLYGESVANRDDARRRNLLGQLILARDAASETAIDGYDPDGHPLSSSRRLRADTSAEPDWHTIVPLDAEIISTKTSFDAVGRIRGDTLADGSTRAYEYMAGGELTRVRLSTPDGKLSSVPILNGAVSGVRGEPIAMTLGNGVQLTYTYEPDTQRLAMQTAMRGTRLLQQLGYTYDPVGNIVRITDDAQEGPAALISGVAVPARCDHVYDAHYRLREATGRVHQALLQWDAIPGAAGAVKGTRLISFNDGVAVERYTRRYDYDASGNLTQMRHLGTTRNWTTDFWISPNSNRSLPALDPGGNPLTNPEQKFDVAGNLRELPNLREMQWNWASRLAHAIAVARPGSTDDDERYVYGADGRRVLRQTTRLIQPGLIEVTEQAYFGDAERKRIRRNGELVLERWTLHIGNGEERLALVHRWTRDDLAREVDDIGHPRVRYQLSKQRSAVMELDENGKLISYEEYFPYGDTAFVVGDDLREVDRRQYRYSGRERDDFTGLYYYGFRYLAPWMMRWLSPDPIGPSDDLNLYQFVRGNPVCNTDAEGLQSETLQRYGGVDPKFNAAQAMASFNVVHARELGFIVTKVEKLPSGDWLIKETRPLSPAIKMMEGAAPIIREFADHINTSLAIMDADSDPGENPSPDPAGDDEDSGEGDAASGAADDETGDRSASGGDASQTQFRDGDSQDLGDGNGGQGQKGEGMDARGHDVGPSKPGDAVPDDQSAKEGKAGGTGVGTGTGVTSGGGASTFPGPKTGSGVSGTADQPAGGAATANGGTGGKGRVPGKPGGTSSGVSGGQGSTPPSGNVTQVGANTQQTGNNGSNGGLTDPKLTPSATGQPPPPGTTKQGKDPNGPLDGGTADTARPEAPGKASDAKGNGAGPSASGGQGTAIDGIPTGTDTSGGHAGRPGGDSDGTPGGSLTGAAIGGGDIDLGWFGHALAYIAKPIGKVITKVLGVAFSVLEIMAGLLLLVLPEPTITKAGGLLLCLHGVDSLVHSIVGGRTWTAQGFTRVAKAAGASDQTAEIVGDVADVAVPLGAGVVSGTGRTLGRLAESRGWSWFRAKDGWNIPHPRIAGLLRGWYFKGIENDAAYWALSEDQQKLYELGQRTLTKRGLQRMTEALGANAADKTISAAIFRGKWLKIAKSGWFNWKYRWSWTQLVTKTFLQTGPTPALRRYWLVASTIFFTLGTAINRSW
jgi:RHS repeat-associated protein